MRVYRARYVTQIIFFLLLMYGAYVGLRFGNFLPMWRCPNQYGYSQGCYLLPLQRFQYGLTICPQDKKGLPFPAYVVMWGQTAAYLRFFLSIIIFIIIFNKLWCGWFCPFGTFQDGVSFIRKKIGIREVKFSERTKYLLMPFKYILLVLFLSAPIIFALGFKVESPLFCKICPVKSILNLFGGNALNLSIWFPSDTMASILTCIITGITLTGIFFRKRLFCLFCPIAAFINIFNKFSLLQIKKNVNTCTACGNCWQKCPMDIKEVYLEREKGSVLPKDCIFCLRCIETCPQDDTLSIKFFKKVFFSSKRYLEVFKKK